jgi:hypothetical protein
MEGARRSTMDDLAAATVARQGAGVLKAAAPWHLVPEDPNDAGKDYCRPGLGALAAWWLRLACANGCREIIGSFRVGFGSGNFYGEQRGRFRTGARW